MKLRGNPLLKSADRYLGMPVLALLGLLPKRRMPRALTRVGILRSAAIGDTLLLSGPLIDLRRALPAANIVLVTGEDNAEAGALIAHDCARHLRVSVRRPMDALRALRRERFDVLIDTGAWPRLDAILTVLSSTRFSVGFRTPGQARHFAYDATVPHSSAVHELENFRALLRSIGIEANAPPHIATSQLQAVPGLPPTPFVVFHPWSGGFRGELKEWPSKRWVELAKSLSAIMRTVVVTGSSSDATRSDRLVADLRYHGVVASSLAGSLTLAQLASVLRDSLAAICVNTGVMHLAAIIGAPTVGLDGPTPAVRWGPVGPRAVSVASRLPGCGFLDLGFEYRGHRADCMLDITVDDVVRGVRTVIDASRLS